MPNGEPEIDGTADRARESNFSAAPSGTGDEEHDRDHGEEKGGPFLHGVLSRSDPFSRFYLVADGSHASCPAFEKAGLYRDPACCDPCGKVSPAGCRSARSPRRCTAKIRRTRRSASRSARITAGGNEPWATGRSRQRSDHRSRRTRGLLSRGARGIPRTSSTSAPFRCGTRSRGPGRRGGATAGKTGRGTKRERRNRNRRGQPWSPLPSPSLAA